jgi:hypothetical protein
VSGPWQWSPSPLICRKRCYISGLANNGGYHPSSLEVDQYAIQKEPAPPSRDLLRFAALRALETRQGEAVASYMRAVNWVRPHESGGLQLTRLGAALVRGLGVEGVRPPVQDRAVILRNDDPARYEVLVRALAHAKGGLLADPYLREDMLDLLADGTSLRRLMLSKRVPKEDRTLIALRLCRIAASDPERQLEVRASTDERFHDRYLLHEDGSLDLIGASVNSMDTRITAVVPLSASAQQPLRNLVEFLWRDAQRIEPRDPREPEIQMPDSRTANGTSASAASDSQAASTKASSPADQTA